MKTVFMIAVPVVAVLGVGLVLGDMYLRSTSSNRLVLFPHSWAEFRYLREQAKRDKAGLPRPATDVYD
jgi:hypothetical protein